MTYSSDRKVFSCKRANSQLKATCPRLHLILAGHRRRHWLEMRRDHCAAVLREGLQQRKMTPRIPAPPGGKQSRAGGLRCFKHHNLE